MSFRGWTLAVGLGGLLAVLPAFAANSSPALDMAKKRVEEADFRATGRFVVVDAGGKRTNFPMTLKGRWMEGALHLLCVISGPPEAAERVWMMVGPDGKASVKVEKAGEKTPHEVPVAKWGDAVVGAMSFDDLLESQYFWAAQSVTPHVKYGARDCDLVTSTAGPSDKTGYAVVKTWLDEKIGFPVHAEKTEKRGGAVKDFTYYGLRQTEGVWSASQVEAKVRGGQGASQGSTLLVIERGSPHAHVGPEEFNPDSKAP